MSNEDFAAETHRILESLSVAASKSDFAAYCEIYDLCQNLDIPPNAVKQAYKRGVAAAEVEVPFFRQNCSVKTESEYTPAKIRGNPSMQEFTTILNNLAKAANSGEARAYRNMVAMAKFAGANNDQLRDSYEYGRRKLGSTWFGWDGTKLRNH